MSPTYTFQCPKCGLISEDFRPISKRDDPEYCKGCPDLTEMKKVMNVPNQAGFILKGSGWAFDGYRKGGNE